MSRPADASRGDAFEMSDCLACRRLELRGRRARVERVSIGGVQQAEHTMRLDAAFVELQRLERCFLGLGTAVPAQLKGRDFRSDLGRHRVGTRGALQRGQRAVVIAKVFQSAGVQEFEVRVRRLSGDRRYRQRQQEDERTRHEPATRGTDTR